MLQLQYIPFGLQTFTAGVGNLQHTCHTWSAK